MATILKVTHAVRRFLLHAWRSGFDNHDARHQLEAGARRIFDAIVTDRCGECLAPIASCRQAH